MAPKVNAAKLVAKLEQLVLQQERQVELLTAQRRELLSKATAAQAAVQQCEAMLQLSHAIRGSSKRGGGGAGGGAGGGCTDSDRAACGAAGGGRSADAAGAPLAADDPACTQASSQRPPDWQEDLRGMIRDLSEAGAGQLSPGGSNGGPSFPAPDLGWTLRGAIEMYEAGADLTTVAGVRRLMSDTIKSSSCLLVRVRSRAPDAEAAARQLRANSARFCSLLALLAVHSTESQAAMGGVLLSRLDAGDAPGGRPPAEPQERPSEEQIRWAIGQLHLEPWQEDPVVALLSLAQSRICAAIARREALVQRLRDEARGGAAALLAGAPAGDVGIGHEETVGDLHSVQVIYMIMSAVFFVAFVTLVRPEQFWGMMAAAFPWCPSVAALRTTLLGARIEALERAAHEPQKRGRGRPRKNPLPEPAPPMEALLKEAAAAAAEAAAAAAAAAAGLRASGGGSSSGGGGSGHGAGHACSGGVACEAGWAGGAGMGGAEDDPAS